MAKRKWTKRERAAQSLKIRAALAAKAANRASFVVAKPAPPTVAFEGRLGGGGGGGSSAHDTPKSSRELRDAVEVLYENNIIGADAAVSALLSITGRA